MPHDAVQTIWRASGCAPVVRIRRWHTFGTIFRVLVASILVCICTTPAASQEIPAGSELIMSDWILGAFLAFFLSGLIVFLTAARLGAFRNLEGAKYYLLTVEEEDYYTPDWAKDDGHDTVR